MKIKARPSDFAKIEELTVQSVKASGLVKDLKSLMEESPKILDIKRVLKQSSKNKCDFNTGSFK